MIVSQSTSLAFTANGPGVLLIMGTLSNVWGYGGGSFRIGIVKTAGTQSIASSASEVSSEGNTIGRSVGAKASVVFTAAGQTITVEISKIDGVAVQNNIAPSIVGIFLPTQNS